MAGVITLAMFGTGAIIALSGSPSHSSRPPLHRPAIAEPLAPAPREQIVAQAPPPPAVPSAFEHEQQMDAAQPTERQEPLIKKKSKHEARTAKGTVLPEETRNYLTAATLVVGGRAANNPSATELTTTPASAIPAALTTRPPGPAFVEISEPSKTDVATAAPANVAAAAAASATPAPVVVASATPAPTATSREGSVSSWCFFTKADGSRFVLNCAEVSAVRAPLEHEFGPEIQAVMSVGRGIKTTRESVGEVRQMVLSHGGHV